MHVPQFSYHGIYTSGSVVVIENKAQYVMLNGFRAVHIFLSVLYMETREQNLIHILYGSTFCFGSHCPQDPHNSVN